MSLDLYSIFHLNLSYSSIEKSDRRKVIDKCYWPLIEIAKKNKLPFGIEISGNTIEQIIEIDQSWISEFKKLIEKNICELIGSGYSQIIAPLAPAEINLKNLKLGNKIYKEVFNIIPKIALVNEQAFSKSLVEIYKKSAFDTIIMEWNNPSSANLDWNNNLKYFPQKAAFEKKNINLIWNETISFQKFQRYAHGEIELSEILKFIKSHKSKFKKAFPIYGNDVEVFNFRPGRYMTEAVISNNEWERIDKLYKSFSKESNFNFIKPSDVLKIKKKKYSSNKLNLTSASSPIVVKKQRKYNILRWAVTGRNDYFINTQCWKIYNKLKNIKNSTENDWKKLCYFWGSDFRTHITSKRWVKLISEIRNFQKNLKTKKNLSKYNKTINVKKNKKKELIEFEKNFLLVKGKRLSLKFNCNKGISLDSFIDNKISKKPLFGKLDHEYFQNISLGADWFSGHLSFEPPGKHKVTDMHKAKPKIINLNNQLVIKSSIETSLGLIKKEWVIDDMTGKINLKIKLDWDKPILGSLRLGYITLIPETFNKNKLYYASHNGGFKKEFFKLDNHESFDHGRLESHLISANQSIGVTEGEIELGDNKKKIIIKFDKSQSALVGLVTHKLVDKKNFTRIAFSASEIDDTSKNKKFNNFETELNIFARKT